MSAVKKRSIVPGASWASAGAARTEDLTGGHGKITSCFLGLYLHYGLYYNDVGKSKKSA